MKDFFQTINKLYNPKLIIVYIIVFIIIRIPAFQIIPDYLNLQAIESAQDYILRLLSIVIGFSSFILTLLLVVYNNLSKKIRRYSFEFIFDNPWIKLTFNLFCGSLIFISLSLFTAKISTPNTVITLLYFSSFITFTNLFIQFPLIILSIKYSNSYANIKKLISAVNQTDIDNLYKPDAANEIYVLEILEKNKLIQLKDFGVLAIKDNDWGLPQTIINGLYEKLIEPLSNQTEAQILQKNVYAFNFICKHFKKVSIEESDDITINVLLNNLIRTQFHFVRKEIRELRQNPIDENLLDTYRLLIISNEHYNLQPYLLRSAIEIISEHIKSWKYTDEQVPTTGYYRANPAFREKNYTSTIEKNYWFYLNNELPDLLFKPLEWAIENKNKNVYEYFNWKLHSLLDNIADSKSLTQFQEEDLFEKYSYKARRLVDFAIGNGIYENLDFYSHLQIERWIVEKKKYGFSSLHEFSFLITKLNNSNKLPLYLLDDYFMVGRSIAYKDIELKTKQDVISEIIEDGFIMLDNPKTIEYVKIELIKQLKWMNNFLDDDDLLPVKLTFSEKINALPR